MHWWCACMLSCFGHVQLCKAPALWTVAFQAPLAVGFSRQKHCSGLSCPPAGDLPNPGIEPMSLMSPALAVGFFFFLPQAPPWKLMLWLQGLSILKSSNWSRKQHKPSGEARVGHRWEFHWEESEGILSLLLPFSKTGHITWCYMDHGENSNQHVQWSFRRGGRWEVVKPESSNSPSRLWDEWEVIQKQRQKKNCKYLHHSEGFLGSSAGKNPPAQRRPQLDSWVRKIPWRRDSSPLHYSWVSLVAQTVKNPPAKKETWIRPQAWADPLEEGMATHSSILAWRILSTEWPGGLQSVQLQRIRHDWAT